MRETRYRAIILKKQPLFEADELVTFYSREKGKIKGLARAVKSPKSRLQQKLQTLFLVDVRLAGGSLPKIIGAEIMETYPQLRQNLEALKPAFYALELVLKISADEHKNEALFELLKTFLEFLNTEPAAEKLECGFAKFKLAALAASGTGLSCPKDLPAKIYFSSPAGGFVLSAGREVSLAAVRLFRRLETITFQDLGGLSADLPALPELNGLLSEFVEYQLERRLKSENLLKVL